MKDQAFHGSDGSSLVTRSSSNAANVRSQIGQVITPGCERRRQLQLALTPSLKLS